MRPSSNRTATAVMPNRWADFEPMPYIEAEMMSLPKCEDDIPTIDASDLTAAEFAERFMRPNKPVMLTNIGCESWKAFDEWTKVDGSGERVPDVSRMSELFGDAKVLVVDCEAPLDTDLSRREMRFEEYARYFRSRGDGSRSDGGDKRLLYCKDWTFTEDFPEYPAYQTPPHFADDWLNEYWDEQRGKGVGDGLGSHRFVYLGVEGTHTPLHADVLRSFSWSVNLAGHKRWLMVPPHRSRHLLDCTGRRHYHDVERWRQSDWNTFPTVDMAFPLMIIQPPNSALFVPSLWYHQVRNLTDCLSVNHNWFNASNARFSWAMLRDELDDVRAGLPDQDDRGDGVLCQSLVERKAGADFKTFAGILASAIRRYRRRAVGECESESRTRSGKRRRLDGENKLDDENERGLRVAVDLLEEVLDADDEEGASAVASAWEGSEGALEEARDALKKGRETLVGNERLGRRLDRK
ncbi:JmjN/JmjC protein [Micromonas commoda]|uniref:JmjN/JmjC protein n=1 Tax=Micromonas commoda (strain RCC299 / NOUM17 / CCMP2709) TaxID=296587 RepID=C1E8E7_MICCC|nr:JmjN/JmjC protein [Micromonas commoda]ACO64138.1 JmjN/JmjC protein [Micromonas commoda]|eukprot:XP_002502880.1 JmjN/JmjC protein [Micromonas commoda]